MYENIYGGRERSKHMLINESVSIYKAEINVCAKDTSNKKLLIRHAPTSTLTKRSKNVVAV